jgi:phosphoglycerate dehydrogenase-like enzyme
LTAEPIVALVPDHEAASILDGIGGIQACRAPWNSVSLHDAQALVAPLLVSDLPDFSQMPSLRLVQSVRAGVDLLLGRVPKGVALCDARGVHEVPVAEWVLAALLASFRNFPDHRDDQRERRWNPTRMPRELSGARVMIVGAGSIGEAVARRLAGFEAQVIRVARAARDGVHGVDALDDLLPAADAVVLLLPLTDATRGLFDAHCLAAMKDAAVLINAARGPVVDQDALEQELRRGRLRAVLDVSDPEPLPRSHSLWSAPGLMITPHLAGLSMHTWDRVFEFVREQLLRLRDGRELENVVGSGGY